MANLTSVECKNQVRAPEFWKSKCINGFFIVYMDAQKIFLIRFEQFSVLNDMFTYQYII